MPNGCDRAEAAGRVTAAGVTVTPPGIPPLVPGESAGAPEGPLPRRLGAVEAYRPGLPGLPQRGPRCDRRPRAGDYLIACVRRARSRAGPAFPDRRPEPPGVRASAAARRHEG
ncbi:hypothetical protein [Streptomyces glaucescens]|uniref:Orn/Lys/Arg family decarboxylase n=1 Tax=Streptomyces glaucescens TaxID=1907 RepID=UPI002989E47B|nr:hypothetical protein [Streptomyces glaucescens]